MWLSTVVRSMPQLQQLADEEQHQRACAALDFLGINYKKAKHIQVVLVLEHIRSKCGAEAKQRVAEKPNYLRLAGLSRSDNSDMSCSEDSPEEGSDSGSESDYDENEGDESDREYES